MEPDRWDRLAESLWVEECLDSAEIDAVAQAEVAQVELTHRLHASDQVVVRVGDLVLRGAVAWVGLQSLVLRGDVEEWLIVLDRVDVIEGLGSSLRWQPSRSSQRASLASMLRDWLELDVRVHLRAQVMSGTLVRVGRDHVDLEQLAGQGPVAVPFSAIACVRRSM